MGDCRNSLDLAKLAWKIHGFDMSEVAVNIAKRHATELGLRIDAITSTDANYEFGKERFDLILFNCSMPLVDVRKVIDALKPGGIVVMDFGPGFVQRNGVLRRPRRSGDRDCRRTHRNRGGSAKFVAIPEVIPDLSCNVANKFEQFGYRWIFTLKALLGVEQADCC